MRLRAAAAIFVALALLSGCDSGEALARLPGDGAVDAALDDAGDASDSLEDAGDAGDASLDDAGDDASEPLPTCNSGEVSCADGCRIPYHACGSCEHDCRDVYRDAGVGAPIQTPLYEAEACVDSRCYFVFVSFTRPSCASHCGAIGLSAERIRGLGVFGTVSYSGTSHQTNLTVAEQVPPSSHEQDLTIYPYSSQRCGCIEP